MKSLDNIVSFEELTLKAGRRFVVGGLFATAAFMMFAGIGYGEDRLRVKDSGGNTQFVVTDAGNTGIGTAAPGAALHVSDGGIINARHSDDANGATMYTRKSRGTEAAPERVISGDYIGGFYPQGYDGSAYQRPAYMAFRVDGTVSSGSVPTAFVVYTGSSPSAWKQRFRISSAGNVGIGVNPTRLLHLSGGAYSNGSSWVNASSREYKENISELSAADANETLNGLNPVLFNYKNDKAEKHVGFIAEDVPELVATNDRKGLSSMDIVAVLTKVVQNQKQAIETLKNQMEGMREELDRLKAGRK